MLNKSTILQALERLGELAEETGLHLHICIYGGSAMLLAYDSRDISRDVDVVIHPVEAGLEPARQVGDELGLHRDWLNDEVRFHISENDRDGRRSFELPFESKGLKVEVPTANYLLAMKAKACREPVPGAEVDAADLRFLIRKMKIRSFDQIRQQLDRFFPEYPLRPGAEALIQRLIEEVCSE